MGGGDGWWKGKFSSGSCQDIISFTSLQLRNTNYIPSYHYSHNFTLLFFFNEPLFKECSWIGNESVNHTSFNYFLTSDRSWSIPTIARA